MTGLATTWRSSSTRGAGGGSGALPLGEPGVEPAAHQAVRVLIVEDEWLIASEIEATLLDAGYAVVGIAASAEEAVSMTTRLKPHIATMDIRLEGKRDGVDAATELYRRHGVRSLFVSAHSSDTVRERAAVARPLGWLPKPFVSAQLVMAVEDALRTPSE